MTLSKKLPSGFSSILAFITLTAPLRAQVTQDFSFITGYPVDVQALEMTPPTPPEDLPAFANYFSAQNLFFPPLPGDIRNLPAWYLSDGAWLMDDLDYNYGAEAQFQAGFGAHPMDAPTPGSGGTSDGSGPTGTYNLPNYTTNDLWLDLISMTNTFTGWTAGLTIHTPWDDTNLTHDLFYATDLNPPVNWRFFMRCPSTNVTAMELCEPQGYFKLGQTNGALTVSTNWTAQQLAEMLVPAWVTVTNATYTGSLVARGTFAGGNGCGLPLDTGVILSTGYITNAIGPNDDDGGVYYDGNAGPSNLGESGDADLDSLVGGSTDTYDAAILEFDIISTNSFLLQCKYFFASEEYPEYCGSQFNDPMAIFVSTNRVGTNWINSITNDLALVPGTTNVPVTVNTINGGCLYHYSPTNAEYYVDNHDPYNSAATNAAPAPEFNFQYDGMTVLLLAQVNIFAGVTNHVKIAIEDFSDASYDSAIFISAAPIPCD